MQNYLGIKASEMYRVRLDILEDLNSCFEKKTTINREMKYFFSSLKEEKDLLVKYAFLPPDLVLVHTEDITKRKKAEEKVQYQAKLVEDIADAIISTDLDFNIISWNKAAESIYGWKAEDTIGKNLRETIPVEYPYDEEKDVLKKFFEDGFWIGEAIQNHKDGTPINILASVSLIKDIAGNPIGAVAINRDISEQKLVEQKLKESESKLRGIFEAIPDLYFLLSEDTTILDFRGKKQNLYIQPEEFMQKKVVDVLPPYIGEQTIKMVKKTIMTKQPQSLEYELLMQNKIHFFEARYFYLSKNRVSCFIRDITERKKIEKEISDLAKFPSENPNPVLRVDKEKILYINQSGKYLFDTTEGGNIPILLEKMINEAFDDNTAKFLEIEVKDKIYSFDIAPIQQEGYANIYGQDITDRKNSEIALNIEKQFTEDILNSSLDTIFVFDPETGKALRWNKVFKDVSGYSDEEISSMKAPDSYYSEEDLKIASEAIKRLIEEGKTTLELSFITKDGRRIPYEYKATVLKEPNGKFSIVSIGRDMTERKEAEQKLKESEENFRNIAEQSFMGISVIQNGIFKYINERMAEVNGYPADEIKNWKSNEFAKIIHPEDREFVMEQANKKQEGDTDVINQYSFRLIKKSGEIRWLEIFSKTINYEGSPADLTMTIDITDKIKAEKKLKESEIIFRDLYEEAP
ncbi:MAG: PAS domain S-box protein, partial [Candidatus Lokiarchaeota archaeon]|nr:PAS domain S-box protein [Candidatus Lokiarchaeota archaeon]